jgi:hypothetical protein
LAAKDQDQAIAVVMFTRLAIALEIIERLGGAAGQVVGLTVPESKKGGPKAAPGAAYRRYVCAPSCFSIS